MVRLNSETEYHVEELLIGDCNDAIPILVLLTEELSQTMKGNAALNEVIKIYVPFARSVKPLHQDIKE